MQRYQGDPEKFVEQNHDTLVKILKHSDDKFVRGLALSALIEYGKDPLIEDIEQDLKRARENNGGPI
jgi:hypothetical protein